MDEARLRGVVRFLQATERLKDTLRSGFTAKGYQESTAEHTWRLTLMVMMFAKELDNVDELKLIKLCIVHDLGEAISGDIPAVEQHEVPDKIERERADLLVLCEPLPEAERLEILSLWEEYEAGETREAIYAKGFDKLETILQHNSGSNPPDFDYEFNLSYGKKYTDRDPLLAQIRAMLDEGTRSRMDEID